MVTHREPASARLLAIIVLLWLLGCTPGRGEAFEPPDRCAGCVIGATHAELALGKGHFLIAHRGMADPRFARTVVLLLEYGPGGAKGLIVNRTTRVAHSTLWSQASTEDVAWYGGPVRPNVVTVLVDSSVAPPGSIVILTGLHFSASRVLIESLMSATEPARFRVYLGYAGWAPGQLDAELARGDWHVRPASIEQVFSSEGERLWRSLVPARGRWVRTEPSSPEPPPAVQTSSWAPSIARMDAFPSIHAPQGSPDSFGPSSSQHARRRFARGRCRPHGAPRSVLCDEQDPGPR